MRGACADMQRLPDNRSSRKVAPVARRVTSGAEGEGKCSFLFFKKSFILILSLSLCGLCVCVGFIHMSAVPRTGRRRMSDFLELELQVVMAA